MSYIIDILSNNILQTALISWAVAQLIKAIIALIKYRRFDFTRLFGSGGMPSSHSAFTVSLAVAVGLNTGFNSVEFAITAAFAIVVMYDATGVRRSAGEQAKILNRIVESLGQKNISQTGKRLKELLGHTPLEVFAGAILGIIIGIVYNIYI